MPLAREGVEFSLLFADDKFFVSPLQHIIMSITIVDMQMAHISFISVSIVVTRSSMFLITPIKIVAFCS